MTEVVLPLTSTGRKYGYITWPKEKDEEVRQLVGAAELTLSLPGGERPGRVDWKHHRLSVGYSVTRVLPPTLLHVRLRKAGQERIEVRFL